MGPRIVTAAMLLVGGYRVGCDCGGPVVPEPYDAGSGDAGTDGGSSKADSGSIDGGDVKADAGTTDAGTTDAGLFVNNPDGGCGPFTAVDAYPGTSMLRVMQNVPTMTSALKNAAAGDLAVVVVLLGQGPPPAGGDGTLSTAPNMAISVTDSASSTWHSGDLYENGDTHYEALQLFYATLPDSGVDLVTVSVDAGPGTAPWLTVLLHQYSGVATSDIVDISTGRVASDAGVPISAGPMQLGRCSLVVGVFTDGTVYGQPLTAAMPWTLRSSDVWDPGAASDNAPGGTMAGALVDPAFSIMFPDGKWLAAQMAFRGAATSPRPQPDALVISGAMQLFPAGACAGLVLYTAAGASAFATSNGIDAAFVSQTLAFFADPGCSYPVTTLHIGAGTSAAEFYVRPASGMHTVTATAPGLMPAMATFTVN